MNDIMSLEELQESADIAFNAILKNTGVSEPHATVYEAYNSVNRLLRIQGLGWVIDATLGTGMSHMGLAYWMSCAKHWLDK